MSVVDRFVRGNVLRGKALDIARRGDLVRVWWSHDALVFEEGTRLTFPRLAERSRLRARQLRGLGVERGETVGILMGNRAEYVEYLFGIARLGAVAIPINARFKASCSCSTRIKGWRSLFARLQKATTSIRWR